MIRVECPYCHRRYRTKLEAIGRTAVCTLCSQSFKIGEARPKFEWRPTDIAEDSWIGVEPPQEKEELKHCLMCDAPMEPGMVFCPACGANQVTGVVHRHKPKSQEVKPRWWSGLPLRTILLVVVVAAVVLGVYRVISSVGKSAASTAERFTYERMVGAAAKYLRDGGDVSAFAEKFGDRVTDDNLPGLVNMLSAGDPQVRQAVILLMATGDVTRLAPIVSRARSSGVDSTTALEVLDQIGLRRLVDLSGRESPEVRQPAAEALCLLCDLKPDEGTITQLAEPVAPAEKIRRLNHLCRPWPRATGRFGVLIDNTEAPFELSVEQIGRVFYLRINAAEFRSSPAGQRRFEIPIDRWCVAAGSAVDLAEVRRMMNGSVTLESPYGEGWTGQVRIAAKLEITRPAGFLPIGPLASGDTLELPIRLESR